MSADQADTPAELPVLLGPGDGEPERLLLLGAPRDGRVAVREWNGDNWSGGATTRTEDAATLLRWLEGRVQAGRTMNQSLYGVRLWLRGEGVVPPTH